MYDVYRCTPTITKIFKFYSTCIVEARFRIIFYFFNMFPLIQRYFLPTYSMFWVPVTNSWDKRLPEPSLVTTSTRVSTMRRAPSSLSTKLLGYSRQTVRHPWYPTDNLSIDDQGRLITTVWCVCSSRLTGWYQGRSKLFQRTDSVLAST